MLNKVTLIGRVGQDPDIRQMQTGDRLANLSLATSEIWKDKATGERKEKTEWHKVTIFNQGLVNLCEQYITKGTLLYIEGKMVTRKWQADDGTDRYSTEITLNNFDSKLKMLSSNGGNNKQQQPNSDQHGDTTPDDDVIPF